jgi:hypothetical protein
VAGRIVLAAALAAALVCAAVAGATVEPGKGIAGVRLGMTLKQVRSVLGVPKAVNDTRDERGKDIEVWGYDKEAIGVVFQGKPLKVILIGLGGKGHKLPSGLGVGSREIDLHRRFPRLGCARQGNGYRLCWLGSKRKGKPITAFYIPVAVGPVNDRGIVSNVSVGYVKYDFGDPFTGKL